MLISLATCHEAIDLCTPLANELQVPAPCGNNHPAETSDICSSVLVHSIAGRHAIAHVRIIPELSAVLIRVIAMTSTTDPAGHAFISYVREDQDRVKEIVRSLNAADVPIWTDKTRLSPGEDWQLTIRKAIQRNALAFIAVFSRNSAARERSYQHEELNLAAEQFRLHPPGRVWLIPVRLDDCELPDYVLGAGRTLDSLQRVDLFGEDAKDEMIRLVASVLRVLGEGVIDSASLKASITQAERGSRGALLSSAVKSMLLEPRRQIELNGLVKAEAERTRKELADTEVFPESIPLSVDADTARRVVSRFEAYWAVVEPLATALVTGCAWGTADQANVWAQAVRLVASTVDGPKAGNTYLLAMQEYPLQALVYAAALGAMARKNYPSLKAVTVDPVVRQNRDREPAISHMTPYGYTESFAIAANLLAFQSDGKEVDDDTINSWSRVGGLRHTPISDSFHSLLAPLLRDLVPDFEDYSDLFDETEVLMGVIAADASIQARNENRYLGHQWYGRFTWRDRHTDRPLHRRMQAEFEEQGGNWPPLGAGLFGGSQERAKAAFEEFCDRGDEVIRHRW